MRYTTIIFDFDFTLADATPGIVGSVNYALGQLGLESQKPDDIRKTVGMTLTNTFFELTGIPDRQAAERFAAHFKDMADQIMTGYTVLFADAIKVLSQLKQDHINTAIVTSKLHYRIVEVLEKYAIANLLDCVVGFEDVAEAKPSPEGLLKVIAHFGCPTRDVLYVGDSLIDAQTAANVPVDFAAVTTGTTATEEFLSLPHVCIADSLTQLLETIDSL